MRSQPSASHFNLPDSYEYQLLISILVFWCCCCCTVVDTILVRITIAFHNAGIVVAVVAVVVSIVVDIRAADAPLLPLLAWPLSGCMRWCWFWHLHCSCCCCCLLLFCVAFLYYIIFTLFYSFIFRYAHAHMQLVFAINCSVCLHCVRIGIAVFISCSYSCWFLLSLLVRLLLAASVVGLPAHGGCKVHACLFIGKF